MNELNRNTRTLIVSFVVAIFALIPLRFMEASQSVSVFNEKAEVLGEQTEERSLLEAPYDVLESKKDCLSEKTALELKKQIEELTVGDEKALLEKNLDLISICP